MLVLVPTYKRLDSLYRVLYSLLNSDLPYLENKARVAIVNNYPPNEENIINIIKKIKKEHKNSALWEWTFINREKTLPPVQNWYDAVFQLAENGEIVFFVGDDDPLPIGSLSERYTALTKSYALYVFGKLHSVFFPVNSQNILLLEYPKFSANTKATQVNYNNFLNCTSIHISNHCFKFDERFTSSYRKAMGWCDKLEYVDFNTRTLFIPLFIPLAALTLNYSIIFIDNVVIFRGMSIQEISSSNNGIANWDLGFISLAAYVIIKITPEIEKNELLNDLKNDLLSTYKNYYYTTRLNKKVDKVTLHMLEKEAGFDKCQLSFKDYSHNLFLILKNIFRINGITLKFKALKDSINADGFFLEN
jgi:hypothetical protein